LKTREDVNAQNQDARKIIVNAFKKELPVEFTAVVKTAIISNSQV
jgi:hypothetical protein